MSTTTIDPSQDSPPPSPPQSSSPPSPPPPAAAATAPPTTTNNIVEDVIYWRKKKVSASTMVAATATWVLLQIYQFNFLTVVSWISMAVVISSFLWGNLMRLLGKQAPREPKMEAVSERTAVEAAEMMRGLAEEAVRWMLKLGAESEWYEFACVVGGLLVFSWISSRVEFLTLLYTGVMMGLSAPLVYVKYEDRIRGYWEHMRVKVHMWCKTLDDKVLTRMKEKMGAGNKNKEKKME